MAAPSASSSLVRVRLYFDYPPPCMPDCRMSWVLLDLNRCRVVTDLCSVIRERFNYSRRAELDLFIQDCFLPPAESIHVVRDEDIIRVKVSGYEVRKRRREEDDSLLQGPMKKNKDGETQINELVSEMKKKKKKKRRQRRREEEKRDKEGLKPAEDRSSKSRLDQTYRNTSSSVYVNGKHAGPSVATEDGMVKKKSPKTSTASETSKCQKAPKPSTNSKLMKKSPKQSSSDSSSEEEEKVSAGKKSTLSVTTTLVSPKSVTSSKKKTETSSDSSSSDEDSCKAATVNVLSKPRASSNPGSVPQTSKKASVSQAQPSSDSSSSSSDEAEATAKTQTCPPDPPPSTPICRGTLQSLDSDSTDTELVIKKPNLQLTPGLIPRGRGRGFPDRARNRGGGRGGFGRARGTPWKRHGFHFNYDKEEKREAQTNKSLVIQNPPEPVPKRDYVTLPLLAAPPAIGTKIAFKLLELTENYSPEVSDYKEGKVVGFNSSTNMMELELLSHTQARNEPGKFDLVYQDPDGSERVEYAITHGSQLTERWESLLEPRLIVESTA